ncbi:scarecrow-like protein 3 [Phragmites australis]|uniref:scarecrow-like protein 3 n=1 Tax=Phragmites australis TaxID=29695 RepID=UPI002D769A4B|nr:scarecrow-like protein 3 [Phragmites australis]
MALGAGAAGGGPSRAADVVAGRFDDDNRCFARIVGLASVADGPLQRLAVIMADGLVRRLLRLTAGINRQQGSDRPLLVRRLNPGSGSNSCANPWQQPPRLSGGSPDLRITVVHDDGTFLANMSALLRKKAEALDMAFSFHGFLGRLETLDFSNLLDALGIRSGYARVFSCALQMHLLLAVMTRPAAGGLVPGSEKLRPVRHGDDQDEPPPQPKDAVAPLRTGAAVPAVDHPALLTSFLSAVRALSPKVVAVMEQEASHNGLDIMARFEEALHYYAALFEVE